MPKIKISEIDLTRGEVSNSIPNVVYIPGKISSDECTLEVGEPKLFTNSGDFEKAIPSFEDTELGVIMAKHLLSLGLYVLFERVDSETESLGTEHWSKLNDRLKYDVKFISAGGLTSSMEDMVSVATKRGDCVALLDHGKDVIDATTVSSTFSGVNSKFAAAFSPWCVFKIGEKSYTLPGSHAYLAAFAKSVQTNPVWYAVAGSSRGKIPGFEYPVVEYGQADVDVLQARNDEVAESDNVGVAINPICNINPYGYIIWGNRTLLNNDGELVATSFLNVRQLISEINKTLFVAAKRFTFEQNSDILWGRFKAQITPLLDRMQSGYGINGYKLIKEATNKKGTLKAKIRIIPVEAVEDFDLTIELADSLEIVE